MQEYNECSFVDAILISNYVVTNLEKLTNFKVIMQWVIAIYNWKQIKWNKKSAI